MVSFKRSIKITESQEEIQSESETNTFILKAEQRTRYDESMRMIHLNEIEVTAQRIRKDEPRLDYWMNRESDITIRKEDFEKTARRSAIKVVSFAMNTKRRF